MVAKEEKNLSKSFDSNLDENEEVKFGPTIECISKAFSSILLEIILENNENEQKSELRSQQKNSEFYTVKIPSISINSYIDRIIKYTNIEENSLIICLLYIDKLCESSNFLLSENNVHR